MAKPRPKNTRSAGVYSGYAKNFKPVKSSKGTAAEKFVVEKVLGGGQKPTTASAGGKSYPVQFTEAGVSGVVGAAVRSGAKAAGKAASKTRTQVANTAKEAAKRRTPGESATIKRGTQKGRTLEGAKTLEKQEAAAASRKSVYEAPKSTVKSRAGDEAAKDLPRGLSKDEVKTFTSKRTKDLAPATGKVRTPAQAKRAQADLEESLKRGSRLAEEGRTPGDDIPGATSFTPKTKVNPKKPKETPKPKADAKTPKQATRTRVSEELKRNKNVKARKTEIEKDIAEGKRTSLTDPKPRNKPVDKATEKSIARNKRKQEKGSKKFTPARPAAEPVPPKPGSDLVRVPSTQGRKAGGPTVRGGAARPMKATADRREVAVRGTRGDVVPGQVIGRSRDVTVREAERATRPFRRKVAKAAGAGAVGAATAVSAKRLVRGKDTAATQTPPKGAATEGISARDRELAARRRADADRRTREGLLDRFGRRISRKEFNRREAFRKANNLEGMTEAEKKAWRKKNKDIWRKENERRNKYRAGAGKKRFGSAATKKTRNIGGSAVIDDAARKALR